MTERERLIPENANTGSGPTGNDASDGLDRIRARADRLLEASDEAITRALSENSVRFLEATRQSGGQ